MKKLTLLFSILATALTLSAQDVHTYKILRFVEKSENDGEWKQYDVTGQITCNVVAGVIAVDTPDNIMRFNVKSTRRDSEDRNLSYWQVISQQSGKEYSMVFQYDETVTPRQLYIYLELSPVMIDCYVTEEI
jgi:hypothetical protein